MALVRGVIAAAIAPGSIVKVLGVDIDEDRFRAGVVNGGDRGDEREWNGDDLIPRADTGRKQGQMERAGSVVDADAGLRSAIGGEFFLEFGDLWTQGELAAVEHALNSRCDLIANRGVLRLQVDKGNHDFFLSF